MSIPLLSKARGARATHGLSRRFGARPSGARSARRRPRVGVLAGLAVAALTVGACGGSDDAFTGTSPSTSSGAAAAGGNLTVGGANFTEMLIMQQMYGQLLTKAGYTVDYKAVDNREIYFKALQDGSIDVVPEYAATLTEFLNVQKNGENAATVATNDAATTVTKLASLLPGTLKALEPAKAADQNGFAVTKKFAEANNLSTLSDLAKLNKPIRLAATVECPDRPFCGPGLEKTYGLKIAKVDPLGFGSPQAKQAVVSGKDDLVLVGTTDGTLDQLGLVLLKDDKGLQLADNLIPVVNTASAGDPKVAQALNALSAVLTTEDLAALNLKVDGQRQKEADVAKEYLTSKGLL
jgi:osmoprotectant transport system substrate-binding protein